jgi:hypothetical protein
MLVQTPAPMLDFRAYELPKEFQTKPQLYFGYNQAFYNMGASSISRMMARTTC